MEEGHTGGFGAFAVPLKKLLVCEQVPGGDVDELAGRHHARGGEGDHLAEDLAVAAALVEQVRDEVVAAGPAAGADGGADVLEVDAEELGVLAQEPADPAEAGEAGAAELLGEEALEALVDARSALGQADDRGGDVDGQAEAQRGQVGVAVAAQDVQLALGDLDHQVPVALVDPSGGEEAGGLAAVLPVLRPVAVEHRPADAGRQVLDGLHAQPGLHRVGAAQHRPPGRVPAHAPDPVRPALDRAANLGAPAVHLACRSHRHRVKPGDSLVRLFEVEVESGHD
ncbi:hypothetical protein GCM10010170_085660 [Dactylosporangium salmoneum]|uniref:Uncharacterized protein n=1 Tax=Dactylosporangium salmoneum TaxID=53361 RepID=A0ABP5UK02_9ACTN